MAMALTAFDCRADDEHLEDVELMTILGADPKKPRKQGGMFSKIMDGMVAVRKSNAANAHERRAHVLLSIDTAFDSSSILTSPPARFGSVRFRGIVVSH
eukprot:SAG31_NODE_4304_length_3370_cov_1.370835_5_plen_98_part_01